MPAISHASGAVFLIGTTGKILTWNDACERLLGYAPGQALRRPLSELLAPGSRQDFESELGASVKALHPIAANLQRADGVIAPLYLVLAPQFAAPDRLLGFSVAAVPAGEEAETPAASEKELIGQMPLKAMVDLLPNAFYVLNQQARLVMWNTRVEVASQRSHDELASISAMELFAQDERELVAARIAEIFAHDGEVMIEAGMLSKDGRVTPYLFTGARFGAQGGVYLCGMGIDISAKRKQQEQLLLRDRALHASSNGIFIIHYGGTTNPIEYVNPAFEKITGYRAADILGHDSQSICGFMSIPGVDEEEYEKVRRALRERREMRVTLRNMRKSGEIFWNDLTVAPVQNDKGRVTHYIGVFNDVTEAKQRTSFLEHEINHDSLTGLANRNLMWDRLEQAIHMAQRNKTLVATVLVDLDNFKHINDTMGHEAGDEVLKIVARRMLGSIRESDTVARLGGDEFVLILANQPSVRYTLRMIDRLRADMATGGTVGGKGIAIESSMGVSLYPHDGKSAGELIRAADAAMYHAKSSGRNDVHFFSNDMKETTEAKHRIEQHMRQALEREEIFLVYQPKISLETEQIVGAEALLRWRHPQQGVLAASSFIHEAEENGMIVPFGQWVFQHVCEALQRLKANGYPGLIISMNASFREINEKHYFQRMGEMLAGYNLAPHTFELEVSESNLLRNAEMTQGLFDEIGRLGIRLTIDEFGAGMFTLANLQQFPVAHLKIFRTYIDGISQDEASAARAKTIIGMGHLMNASVIGEGVETSYQHDFLKANGCDQMQGNYFSEPIPLHAFEKLLTSNHRMTA